MSSEEEEQKRVEKRAKESSVMLTNETSSLTLFKQCLKFSRKFES